MEIYDNDDKESENDDIFENISGNEKQILNFYQKSNSKERIKFSSNDLRSQWKMYKHIHEYTKLTEYQVKVITMYY